VAQGELAPNPLSSLSLLHKQQGAQRMDIYVHVLQVVSAFLLVMAFLYFDIKILIIYLAAETDGMRIITSLCTLNDQNTTGKMILRGCLYREWKRD
jgi:hypothetical protein